MGLELEKFDHELEKGREERRLREIREAGESAGLEGKSSTENPYTTKKEAEAWEGGRKFGSAKRSTSEVDHK